MKSKGLLLGAVALGAVYFLSKPKIDEYNVSNPNQLTQPINTATNSLVDPVSKIIMSIGKFVPNLSSIGSNPQPSAGVGTQGSQTYHFEPANQVSNAVSQAQPYANYTVSPSQNIIYNSQGIPVANTEPALINLVP